MSDHENYRNEIKAYIVRAGMTMSEVVEVLADEYGWSSSVPNLSGKLKRGSLRYGEAVELADVLGLCPTGSRTEKARAFIDAIFRMNRALGIPERFPCIRQQLVPGRD